MLTPDDPNDHAWSHNQFAAITVPPGATARIYCFVPVGDADGHAHGADVRAAHA